MEFDKNKLKLERAQEWVKSHRKAISKGADDTVTEKELEELVSKNIDEKLKPILGTLTSISEKLTKAEEEEAKTKAEDDEDEDKGEGKDDGEEFSLDALTEVVTKAVNPISDQIKSISIPPSSSHDSPPGRLTREETPQDTDPSFHQKPFASSAFSL